MVEQIPWGKEWLKNDRKVGVAKGTSIDLDDGRESSMLLILAAFELQQPRFSERYPSHEKESLDLASASRSNRMNHSK